MKGSDGDPLVPTISAAERHVFGSFRLVKPEGTEEEWNDFRSRPTAESLKPLLNSLPLPTIIVLCRRHPEDLPHFLDFFDRSPKADPCIYLPYLCQHVKDIPIRWIIHHIMIVSDVRYAYQLSCVACANSIFVDRRQRDFIKAQAMAWEKFQDITQREGTMTYGEAWVDMMKVRTAEKELIQFKLTINLAEYERMKRQDLVMRLLGNCDSPAKFERLLRSDLRPYCEARSIDFQPIVVTTVSLKKWPVADKLRVLRMFVDDPVLWKKAIDEMLFKSDAELDMLKKFAAKHNIQYEPRLSNFVLTPTSLTSRIAVAKSHSVGFLESGEPKEVKMGLNMWRRSLASSSMLNRNMLMIAQTFGDLANGEPSDPKGYADKLRAYQVLSEISPIYELTARYGIIMKYHAFLDKERRMQTLVKVITKGRFAEGWTVVPVLEIDPDDLVQCIYDRFDDVKEICCDLMTSLIPYVRPTNVQKYYDFLWKSVEFLVNRVDLTELCGIWMSCIFDTLRSVNGRELMSTGEYLRAIHSIAQAELPDEDVKRLVVRFASEGDPSAIAGELTEAGLDDLAEYIMPTISGDLDIDAFVEALSGDQCNTIVAALTEIPVMQPEEAVEFMKKALEKIKGVEYTLLTCVFTLLEERGISSSKEIEILDFLHGIHEMAIDFHSLMRSPEETLVEIVTVENVTSLVGLGTLLGVDTDVLIVRVILKVMTSNLLEDYAPLLSQLKRKKNNQELIDGLKAKLRRSDLPKFFMDAGLPDMMLRYHTINDLHIFGLAEFVQDKYLDNVKLLIADVYCSLPLREKFGRRLHKLTRKLADRYEMSVKEVREDLIEKWLCECEGSSVVEKPSVFVETSEDVVYKDENANVQRVLFVLRSWKVRHAATYLVRFILNRTDVKYRTLAKAFTCLFAIAEESTIKKLVKGDLARFYEKHRDCCYRGRLETFNVGIDATKLNRETVLAVIQSFLAKPDTHPGVFPLLFDMCIDFGIDDKSLLMQIIDMLLSRRKRFLITHIHSLFDAFENYRNDIDFQEKYVRAISGPFDELIAKLPETRPFKPYHRNIVLEVFDEIARDPFVMDYWIIGGELLTWDKLIGRLCSTGFAPLAAELGSFIVDVSVKRAALNQLLVANHFDNALQFGFDQSTIFSYCRDNALVRATETMFDDNFIAFSNWLKSEGDDASIEIVKQTLTKQGRTMEVKRMMDRFAVYESRLSTSKPT